ncbi:MAG: DUF721 domain-containing protein [Saprospiraceae bacterium]|nr:DUF721 domain-containing protein [Saprospiraceae bacterium]HNL38006.1 DUF721 domain-containing protein [Saprospiraceae bacterium]
MRKKNDVTLQEALQDMLREMRLKPGLDETRLKTAWEKVMGKTITTYTSNIAVRKNVLYLTILSAPLKQELLFSRDRIKQMLNEEMGEEYIREVVIR